uniref:Uncharacterized protein n=1 Tax=Picea glauca TaxID=3330 RepID=A0A101M501_PICGL|nr:hypothetical protein ABT39_MTgene786 [Picea glauca]QHR90507.1 hypothetical protein Q903MT_gene4531 [Picea sitchensis]
MKLLVHHTEWVRYPLVWQVRLCALDRIKPHAPPLERPPSIPLSFGPTVLPRRSVLSLRFWALNNIALAGRR